MSYEEVLGLVSGLASVVKEQQIAAKDVSSQTQQQIQDLSHAVHELSQSVRTKDVSHSSLRLPQLTLPEFTGKENLDRFAEQLTNVLSSSGVAAKFWFTYLKQQCRKDVRAFDIVCTYETTNAAKIHEKTSNDEFITFYDNCLRQLTAQRGVPKEQQIRQLLSTYYSMSQHAKESVVDFSHRFLETQHSLEKLIPGIHRCNGDVELIHAFMLKLQPSIGKELISRDSSFSNLTSVIEAAKRFESVDVQSTPSKELEQSWRPQALLASQPSKNMPLHKPQAYHRDKKPNMNSRTPQDNPSGITICPFYNKFPVAHCELPSHQCSRGYIHKCSTCFKLSCKAHHHVKAPQNNVPSQNFRNTPRNSNQTHGRIRANFVEPQAHENQSSSLLDSVKEVVSESIQSLKKDITTSIENEVKRQLPQPPQAPLSNVATTQDPLYSMPAITSPLNNPSLSALDLAGKHILWTKVTSAGVPLPLPLDSCCSVSLVSQNHAETVAKFNPALQFTKLEQPIPVSVAGPNSTLRAVGVMQVPIVWETGKSAIFTMLVVPNLTWPLLFGQNHLRKTDARIYSKELKVYFADSAMNFEITCYDSNPNEAFPALRSQQPCRSSTANVTCLLTAMPSHDAPAEHVSLTRGLNFVTVCIVIAASLVGSPLLSGPLWLEGTQFSPGLQTLSGPIDLQSLKRVPHPGETPPKFSPTSHPGFSKCRPSRPLPPVKSSCVAVLASQSDDVVDIQAPLETVLVTNVLIRSNKGSAKLPFNVSLGTIRPLSDADTTVYQDAINHTAQQLSDIWYSQVFANELKLPLGSEPLVSLPTHALAMTSGFESSSLSEFLETSTKEHEHTFPPTEKVTVEQNSFEFYEQLIQALELDTPSYAHVPSAIIDKFKALLGKYPHVFHLPNSPLSTIKGFYHNINTGESPPVYRLPYRKSPAELAAIKEELERMVKLKIIQPSHSPWGAPCILVRKPLEKGKPQPPRFVVDYRALNAVTLGDGYPIPNVSNILDAISEGKIFGKLDLASGYWQVPVNPKHREKTAFCTHLGLWENLRMPFGLKTAPQTFQRILNTIFSDFLYKWLIIYIDDCVTWSSSYEEALSHYEQIFERASKFGVQFKPSKCSFFSTNMQILGHRVTSEGRFPTEKGTESISSFPRPHNVSSLKRFLGMVGYFREYIRNMSHRTQNLRSLLSQKASFSWSDQHEAEFQDLKSALLSKEIILFHPDWDSEFQVHTDASKIGCGAMLAQRHNGVLRPVRFASKAFTATESRWPTAHQELFAVKWALEQFRHYLIGRKFKVVTDHANLKFLASIAPQNSKLARWCLSLAEFDFVIEHRPGKDNVVPDALSRAPLPSPQPEVNTLVIPPPEVSPFLLTALCFDLCLPTTSTESQLSSFPFSCVSLACSTQLPLNNHALPTSNRKKPLAMPCTATAEDDRSALQESLPKSQPWPDDFEQLRPLNFDRVQFAQKQRNDPWLAPLTQFILSGNSEKSISNYSQKVRKWVFSIAKRAKLVDGLLLYSDEFMQNPDHLRLFVPSDTELQRHILHSYHDSPLGMHRGRDATYNAVSRDFYWRNLSKHVRNWIRRCPHCIRFKTLKQPHGPMQVRMYQHPFHTLGVDYVGELPLSPSGNKWILTAVCPYSNFLRAIPVPDKTAPTAARALFNEVFLQYGFPAILQSDRGGEFLNAVLHRLTALLSIKQVFTSGYRPRLNGSTERVHRFLNSAIGIYCEHQQEHWENFLQPAVYAHNTSAISGTSDVTPFFLVFGRDAPSPETISLQLPPNSLPADHYAQQLIARMKDAHTHFREIKSDLRRRQREIYDTASRDLHIPDGKLVYVRNDIQSASGKVSRFLRNFDGPYLVTGHPYNRSDLLTLRNASTGENLPRPVNIEKVVVVPEVPSSDLRIPDDVITAPETETMTEQSRIRANPDLVSVAFEFGKYLETLPNKSTVSSQACKFVYEHFPAARDILARHGRLRGLVKSCPYLQLEGGMHGGTYVLSLNQDIFSRICRL